MRAIRKAPEPESLSHYRASIGSARLNDPNADIFDSFSGKAKLRKALVKEQRGLCCYCLSRIRPCPLEMKIEHWRCQQRFAAQRLDYQNLLGACKGNEGCAEQEQHCDTRKANKELSKNPASLSHSIEALIKFETNGRISSNDPQFNDELEAVLNLNLPFLVNHRKETLLGFLDFLGKGRMLKPAEWEKRLGEWNGDSHSRELQPYCQIVVQYLRQKVLRGA